jgi:hypothetical protein
MWLLHAEDDSSNGGSSFCGVSWLLNCWAAMGGDFGVVDHLDAVRGVWGAILVAWGGLVGGGGGGATYYRGNGHGHGGCFFLVLWLVAADS